MKKKEALKILKQRREVAQEYAMQVPEYLGALEVAIEAVEQQLHRWYRPEERKPEIKHPMEAELVLAVVNGYCGNTRLENAYVFARFHPKGGWAIDRFPGERNFTVKKWMPRPDQEDEE